MVSSREISARWTDWFSGAPYIAVLLGMYWQHNAFLSILLYHGLIAVPLLIRRSEWFSPSLFRVKKGFLLPALLIGLASGPILVFLWSRISLPGTSMEQLLADFGLTGGRKWLFLLYFCTFHPLWEEAYWRLLDREKDELRPVKDLFFAGYHLLVLPFFIKGLWLVPALLVLWAAGMSWRWLLRSKKDSLTVILSHALADGSILATVLWWLD